MPETVRLMMVTDRRRLSGVSLSAVVREAARAGVDDIQIREKDLGGRALVELAREIRQAVQGTRVRLLVNGRPDVAVAASADGVQLPEEGLPIADVKRAFPGLAVGASRHSADGVEEAASQGADFVVLGPVFATPGKEGRALGLAPLAAAARRIHIPVYAIGGIEPASAAAVKGAGARGIALLRPFLTGAPSAAVAAFRAALA